MKRELRDELEVPGHVVMHEIRSQDDMLDFLKSKLDEWEAQGYTCIRQVPEVPDKDEFIRYAKALGVLR